MPGCLNNKSIVTRKLEGMNHFHYYLCRQLKGGGMEIFMKNTKKISTFLLPTLFSILLSFSSLELPSKNPSLLSTHQMQEVNLSYSEQTITPYHDITGPTHNT